MSMILPHLKMIFCFFSKPSRVDQGTAGIHAEGLRCGGGLGGSVCHADMAGAGTGALWDFGAG